MHYKSRFIGRRELPLHILIILFIFIISPYSHHARASPKNCDPSLLVVEHAGLPRLWRISRSRTVLSEQLSMELHRTNIRMDRSPESKVDMR